MRPDSPTYRSHFGVELSADNRRALYVPELFAHGYQALTDGAEVTYQVGEFYTLVMSVASAMMTRLLALAGLCRSLKSLPKTLIGPYSPLFPKNALMIIVDRALQSRAAAGNPIKVGMIGAGFMGRASLTKSSTLCRAWNSSPSSTAALTVQNVPIRKQASGCP